jgi:NAD(P)-dependent dehydrogenase (short-subunit alcohol dehydrogenase family)
MSTFANRVVLITGAGSGIGQQFARVLAREGARLALLDWQQEALDKFVAELGNDQVAQAVVDVRDRTAVLAAVARLEKQVGPTDVLIAAAGIFRETWTDDFGEAFTEQIRTNLLGLAYSIEAVLPGMKARRNGQLVALSSIASYHGLPPFAGYCASKAGVNALCEAFRAELRPFGVTVTLLCPGYIRTNIASHMDLPRLPPMLEVGDAVDRMMKAVRRRRSFYAFPARDVWPVRLLRYLPRSLSDWLTERQFIPYARMRGRATVPEKSQFWK